MGIFGGKLSAAHTVAGAAGAADTAAVVAVAVDSVAVAAESNDTVLAAVAAVVNNDIFALTLTAGGIDGSEAVDIRPERGMFSFLW